MYAQGKALEKVFKSLWISSGFISEQGVGAVTHSNGGSSISTSSSTLFNVMQDILMKLRAHQDAFIFLEPVDPAILPDYYIKIKNPIDLSTIQQKLNNGMYTTLDSFSGDFKLMISNCYAYNAKKSFGHNAGVSLDRYIKHLFNEVYRKKLV